MARILLVDNNQDWLDLISGSLPDDEVDTARSYNAALRAIRSGTRYDVAIVDLNLIDSPSRSTQDGLGGKILDTLRDHYPATRRIALTAYPPSSVKQVLEQYDVDDLLLKGNMALSVVPEVVQAALANTSAELPKGVRAQRSQVHAEFDRWRQGRVTGFERELKRLRNDLGSAITRPGGHDEMVAALQDQIAGLEHEQEAFDRQCSRATATLGRIASDDDIELVWRLIDELKREFGSDD